MESMRRAFNKLVIRDTNRAADVPIPPKQTFDTAKHQPVSSSEVGPSQQPQAQLHDALRQLEARAHEQAEGSSRGAQLQAQVGDTIAVMRENVEEVTRVQDQGERSPEEQFKQIGQAIMRDWPQMLARKTPQASYLRILELDSLANRRSNTDFNGYINELRALHERMLSSPDSAIQVEVRPLKNNHALKKNWQVLYHRSVLSKLKRLPPGGLGNEGESQQMLIGMHNVMAEKFNMAVLKIDTSIIATGIVGNFYTVPMAKKSVNGEITQILIICG